MVRKIAVAATRILGVLVAGYVLLVGYLYAAQESLIFVINELPPDHEFTFDLPFEEVTIPVDGAELNGLHFQQPDPRGLVFFLRGNAGNLQSWTTNVDYYQRVNYDMFIFDYRGSGKSTGEIESEAQLHADVRAAWDSLVERYRGKPVVLYGRSLGAALAIKLATEVDAELLVLVSPFESMISMAKAQYPIVPSAAVRYPLRSDQRIGRVRSPILFVHGDRDRVIPLSHSEALMKLAPGRADLLVIEGAGHNDIHSFRTYLEGLAAALPDH